MNKVIILHESTRSSIIKDVFTFVMIVGVIGVGSLMQSSAMQWAGFVMLAFAFLGAIREAKNHVYSIEEARRRLDEIEAGRD